MSIKVDFAALAEGAAGDSRGNLTLVAVNPQVLVAEQLPAQFSLILVVVIVDQESNDPTITPGRNVTARIEATGPDGSVLFVAQLRQEIVRPPNPGLEPRVQIVAQVPFMAAKPGDFTISAHITVVGEGEEELGEITASRIVRVSDAAFFRSISAQAGADPNPEPHSD
jgi:hypothetical protein